MAFEKVSNEENDYQMRQRWMAELNEMPGDSKVEVKFIKTPPGSNPDDEDSVWVEEMTVAALKKELELINGRNEVYKTNPEKVAAQEKDNPSRDVAEWSAKK